MYRTHAGARWLALAALIALLALLALIPAVRGSLAPTAAHADTGAVVENVRVPVSGVAPSDCPGGEAIAYNGTAHFLVTFTTDSAGGAHGTYASNGQGVAGVGVITGAAYEIPINQHDSFSLTAANGYIETFIITAKLIGKGPAANEVARIRAHITTLPDGTVTVFFDSFNFTCS